MQPGKRARRALLISSLAVILLITLYPFQFGPGRGSGGFGPFRFLDYWGVTDFRDIVLNVLLFVPLGFSLTGVLMQREKAARLPAAGVVFLAASALSYAIEALQAVQPSRFSSLADVLANTSGGMIGYACFRGIRHALAGYTALALVLTVFLQSQTGLGNWDSSYYLALGNELTGDRPWDGHVSAVHIADRAVSQEEAAYYFSRGQLPLSMGSSLAASWRFSGQGAFSDETGQLPDLVSIGAAGGPWQGAGVELGSHHWLKSAAPAGSLSERIKASSSFTLIAVAASHRAGQTGPARIVSLSEDPGHRNVTLGQDGRDLVFRLRTPFTGTNGIPNVVIKDIFAGTGQRTVISAYSGSVLRIYVDEADNEHVFEFSPGAAAMNSFFLIDMSCLRAYKVLWYALLLIPFGMLLVLIMPCVKSPRALAGWGILVPAAAVEVLLARVSGRPVMGENLLISLVFISGPLAAAAIQRLFSRNREPG